MKPQRIKTGNGSVIDVETDDGEVVVKWFVPGRDPGYLAIPSHAAIRVGHALITAGLDDT